MFVLQEQQISEAEVALFSVSSYACQRRTTLDNHNSNLTVSPLPPTPSKHRSLILGAMLANTYVRTAFSASGCLVAFS